LRLRFSCLLLLSLLLLLLLLLTSLLMWSLLLLVAGSFRAPSRLASRPYLTLQAWARCWCSQPAACSAAAPAAHPLLHGSPGPHPAPATTHILWDLASLRPWVWQQQLLCLRTTCYRLAAVLLLLLLVL
jgi:hypothetical protein